MPMADAFIVATAIDCGLPLLTANVKHYEFLPSLALECFKP